MSFLSKIKLPDETDARQIIDTRLPTFTSADNGKILVIKNGSWALGENSGGGFTSEVLLTVTYAAGDTFITNYATFWATCGSKTVNPTYQGDYKYLFNLPDIGTWTIYGEYEPPGDPRKERSTLVEVTKIKRYKTSLDFS